MNTIEQRLKEAEHRAAAAEAKIAELHLECRKYRIALNRVVNPVQWGVKIGYSKEIARRALVIGEEVDDLPPGAAIDSRIILPLPDSHPMKGSPSPEMVVSVCPTCIVRHPRPPKPTADPPIEPGPWSKQNENTNNTRADDP